MDSDEESSWHSGMAILEQRSAHRSAGSPQNTEAPTTPAPPPRPPKPKSTRKSTTSKPSKRKHKGKKTKSNNGPKSSTAHPTSRPAQGLTAQPTSNSSTPMFQTPTQQRRPHRQEPAWRSDPELARRCWSELDTAAHVIF